MSVGESIGRGRRMIYSRDGVDVTRYCVIDGTSVRVKLEGEIHVVFDVAYTIVVVRG